MVPIIMPNITKLEKRKRKLRTLAQYKNITDSDLTRIAQESLDSGSEIIPEMQGMDITAKFTDLSERRVAQKLLEQYLSDYAIESVSERNTLQEVIYLEVLQYRLQEKLNQLYAGNIKAIPYDIISIVHKNSEAIIKLKTTLGLAKPKDKVQGYDAFEHLKKRFQKWREENQASRTFKCPHCSKFALLKMRMDAWESQKHPFFKDNTVYNKHLFAHLNQTVVLDRDFIASVLEVSPDYVDWMVNKTKKPIMSNTPNMTEPKGVENGKKSSEDKEASEETGEVIRKVVNTTEVDVLSENLKETPQTIENDKVTEKN